MALRALLLALACCLLAVALAQPRGSASFTDTVATADPAAADALRAAARKLLESVRGDPEFNEALRRFSMEDELKLAADDPARRDWSYSFTTTTRRGT